MISRIPPFRENFFWIISKILTSKKSCDSGYHNVFRKTPHIQNPWFKVSDIYPKSCINIGFEKNKDSR